MKILNVEPPVYLVTALIAMILLHFILPADRWIVFPWNLSGILALAAGIILNLVADNAFKKSKTSVKPIEQPTVLIITGAFRISRNPMYLGFVLILLGVSLLSGLIWNFAVAAFFAVFMDFTFIRYEEKKMQAIFGESWREYKKKVRRWI